LVSVKTAGVEPVDDAVMFSAPDVLLAVNVVAVATPEVLVEATVVLVPLTNVPLAPLAGAVKVTDVPATRTGLLLESSIVTLNAIPRAVPTVGVWPPPEVTTS
jgi:hypothetical protein